MVNGFHENNIDEFISTKNSKIKIKFLFDINKMFKFKITVQILIHLLFNFSIHFSVNVLKKNAQF